MTDDERLKEITNILYLNSWGWKTSFEMMHSNYSKALKNLIDNPDNKGCEEAFKQADKNLEAAKLMAVNMMYRITEIMSND